MNRALTLDEICIEAHRELVADIAADPDPTRKDRAAIEWSDALALIGITDSDAPRPPLGAPMPGPLDWKALYE